MGTMVQLIQVNFPQYTPEHAALIAEEIVSYILGLYPATHLTAKQLEAIILSSTGYQAPDFATLCESGITAFLM